VLLRAGYWLLFSPSPFFSQPVVDASFFDLWAQSLAEGRQMQPDVFFKPPLYPYLLALTYGLWGHNLPAVFFLQTLVGIGSCLLVLAVGRCVFSPRIALGGALACALLPILPFFELQLLAETVTTFLTLLALLLVLTGTRQAGTVSLGRLALAGLVLGIAALGRPNLMLLPPVLAVWLCLRRNGPGRAQASRPRWQAAAILLAGAALAISPVTLRNARVGDAFVPVCANFGVNLWTGHHQGSDGTSPVPVGIEWDDLQLRCRQAGAGSPVASSGFLAREAFREILADPGRAAALLLKKITVLVSAQEVRNNIGATFLAEEQGVFLLARWWPGFWLLGPLAALGLWLSRRWPRGEILWLYLVTMAVSVLPFFVNARFRTPLLPVLALFAAAGVGGLVESLRRWGRGDRRSAVRALLLLAAAILVVNVDWYQLDRPGRHARDHFWLGTIFAREARPGSADARAAEFHFSRAMDLDPAAADFPEQYGQFLLGFAQPLTRRAEVLRQRGQLGAASELADSAATYLNKTLPLHRLAADLYPRSFRSHSNLGSSHLWLGDGLADRAALALARGDSAAARTDARQALVHFAAAGRAYQEALAVWSGFPEASNNLQLCLGRIASLPPVDPDIINYQARLQRPGAGE